MLLDGRVDEVRHAESPVSRVEGFLASSKPDQATVAHHVGVERQR